jgi:hypothetical protein
MLFVRRSSHSEGGWNRYGNLSRESGATVQGSSLQFEEVRLHD